MDSLYCSLEGKLFIALLNGLSKRLFFEEISFTNEYLATQLFTSTDLDAADINLQINAYEQVLIKAADSAWDTATLEDKLKRLTNISEDGLKLFVSFWSTEKDKIHDRKISLSRWNQSFDKLSWRVDVNALAKHSAEAGEPIAYVSIATMDSSTKTTANIDFDMTRPEVIEMVDILNVIQKKFDEASY